MQSEQPHPRMRVHDAARDQVVSCELADGRVAVWEQYEESSYLRGYTVAVEP